MKALSELGISPAPWSADDWSEAEHGEFDVRIRDANDNEIAQPLSTFADSIFIAAAPELYEALELCERKLDAIEPYGELIVQVRAALAKASGEEVAK